VSELDSAKLFFNLPRRVNIHFPRPLHLMSLSHSVSSSLTAESFSILPYEMWQGRSGTVN
jgi:hypothetical protein